MKSRTYSFTFDLLGGHLFSCREPLKGECLSFIEQNVLCNCKIESSVKYFLPIQFKQVVLVPCCLLMLISFLMLMLRFRFILKLILVLMFILMLMSVLMLMLMLMLMLKFKLSIGLSNA